MLCWDGLLQCSIRNSPLWEGKSFSPRRISQCPLFARASLVLAWSAEAPCALPGAVNMCHTRQTVLPLLCNNTLVAIVEVVKDFLSHAMGNRDPLASEKKPTCHSQSFSFLPVRGQVWWQCMSLQPLSLIPSFAQTGSTFCFYWITFNLASVAGWLWMTASTNTLTSASLSHSSCVNVCVKGALDNVFAIISCFPGTCTMSNVNFNSLNQSCSTLGGISSSAFLLSGSTRGLWSVSNLNSQHIWWQAFTSPRASQWLFLNLCVMFFCPSGNEHYRSPFSICLWLTHDSP